MQIKLHLHLLSLWPFMPHIESGNKSLVEFMKHKSRTDLGAHPVTSLTSATETTSCRLTRVHQSGASEDEV